MSDRLDVKAGDHILRLCDARLFCILFVDDETNTFGAYSEDGHWKNWGGKASKLTRENIEIL